MLSDMTVAFQVFLYNKMRKKALQKHKGEDKKMALMEVDFFSKALMRPVTMNVILPAAMECFWRNRRENKPFKTLYLLLE